MNGHLLRQTTLVKVCKINILTQFVAVFDNFE